jgi:hypothetical protein
MESLPQIMSMLGQGANAMDQGTPTSAPSTASTLIKGAASGASLGTSIAPGIGTAIGAGAGLITGLITDRKNKQIAQRAGFHQQLLQEQMIRNNSAAVIGNNPALVTGQPGEEFYASGGFLKNRYYDSVKAVGGNLNSMSASSAEVQGPSHEQGGVDLPQYNSELEGGESIQGDYVFSKRLGFADVHKKLAKAVGKIEKKPATADRINALNSLNNRIQSLQQLQEQIRQQNNLQ